MKKTRKNLLRLVIGLGLLIGLIYGALYLTSKGVPDPVTKAQVERALSAEGIEAMDVTDRAATITLPNTGLLTCLIADKGDIHFEFYVFDNLGSAADVYHQTRLALNPHYSLGAYHEQKLGYEIYSIDKSNYSVTLHVDHIAIYAYCRSENQQVLHRILHELGYKAPARTGPASLTTIMVARIVPFLLSIPAALMVRGWIWSAACHSANVSAAQVEEAELSRTERNEYLMEHTKRKGRTRAYLRWYKYICYPHYIGIILAMMTLFVPQLVPFINSAGLPIIAMTVFSAPCAALLSNYEKRH